MSEELKPCPWCGAKAEVWQDNVRTWGLIEHKPDCWLAYDVSRHKQEIPRAEFAAWNRRAGEDAGVVRLHARDDADGAASAAQGRDETQEEQEGAGRRRAMQHIVEVAFDYNDKAITEYIENQLENDVRDCVTSKAWKEFSDHVPSVTYDRDRDFMEYMADAVYKRFMDEHGDELVRLAALTLAKRTSCRKAWKEALADAEAELGGKEGGNEQD